MTNWTMLRWLWIEVALLVGVSQSAWAQSGLPARDSMYYTAGSGQPLAEALALLSTRYQLDFAFSPEAVEPVRLPGTAIAAPNLEALLSALLKGTGLEFQVAGPGQILLRRARNYTIPPPSGAVRLVGKVVDMEDGSPLANVAVFREDPPLGAYTDDEGRFELTLPAAAVEQPIRFYLVGYLDTTIASEALLEATTIRLARASFQLSLITVQEDVPTLSVRSDGMVVRPGTESLAFSASNLAGADPLRMLQLLPGVGSDNDLSSEVRIRGSGGDETLLVLDGIPIYRADHFYGIFSAINGDYVRQVDLFKNNMPIQYGGKTGGMVLMGAGDPVAVPDMSAELNLLTTSLSARLPVGKSVGLFLGGRTTLGNAANNALFGQLDQQPNFDQVNLPQTTRNAILETQPEFRFYDLNAKVEWSPGTGHRLSGSFFRSGDDLNNDYTNEFFTQLRNTRISYTEAYANQEDWQNEGFSLNYRFDRSRGLRIDLSVFHTRFENQGRIGATLAIDGPVEDRTTGFINEQTNRIADAGVRGYLHIILPDESELELGSALTRHQNDFLFQEDGVSILVGNPEASEGEFFANYRIFPAQGLTLELGSRAAYYSGNSNWYFAPRVNLFYEASPSFSLKAAVGKQYQFVREISYENRLGQALNFFVLARPGETPVGSTLNYMAGGTLRQGNWTADLELFYRDKQGVLEYAALKPGFKEDDERPSIERNYLLFTGTGAAYGLDLLVRYEQGGYEGWLAYTLSKSVQQFPEIFRNEAFPAQDDRRHQLKFVHRYRWKNWQASLDLIFNSGRPYSDFTLLNQQTDRRIIDPEDRIKRLPDYSRIDLGLSYHFPIGNAGASLGASVFNLTDRENVRYLQYVFALPVLRQGNETVKPTVIGTQTNLLGRTLNLQFRLEF